MRQQRLKWKQLADKALAPHFGKKEKETVKGIAILIWIHQF